MIQKQHASPAQRIGVFAAVGFVGMLFGMLGPVFIFGQRMATLEERSRRTAETITEVKAQLNTVIEMMVQQASNKGKP